MGRKKLGLLAVVLAAVGAVFAKRKREAAGSAGSFPVPTPAQAPTAAEPTVPTQPTADEAGATPGEVLSDSTDEPGVPTTPDAPLEQTTDVADPLTDPLPDQDR